MRFPHSLHTSLIALSLILISAIPAVAVPYASGVRNTGGANWEFVLNEAADSVTVLRDGGNAVNLGAIAAGRHTFDMTGFSTFSIEVSKSAPAAWTTISDTNDPFTHFTIPSGVVVNNDPSNLAFFGTVYVANANPAATKSGRTMGDGIYALTANMKGVDLTTFAAVADPNDASQAKHPGFDVAGSTTSSPWRLSLDASGNLLVADWSDLSGGVKYASRDLTSGGLVLGGVDFNGVTVPDGSGNGPAGGIYSQESDEFGRIPLHGSSGSRVYSTGTVGVDLTLWTMDEDLDVDLAVPNNDTNSIWRYDIGSATNYDALAPTPVVKSTSIPLTSDGRLNFFGPFGPGVATGMLYDPTFNKWYLSQPRTDGNQSAVTILSANLDGSDADAPTVEWSSLQFTIDNGFDADAAMANPQDIFRRIRDVAISPDKKFLVLHRNGADNARFGVGDGAVLLVPLDANGIPMINIEAGNITNVIDITTLGDNGAHNSGAQVEFDAAGNLYVANSAISTASADPLLTGQLIQVFSPGGNWKATTNSAGGFLLTPLAPPMGLAGDYNDDGSVDAADYVAWRNAGPTDTLPNDDTPGTVDQSDYTVWRANFGKTTPPGSGSSLAAVPEPSSLALLLLGLVWFLSFCGKGQRGA